MNLISILGSCRKNGNTAAILNLVETQLNNLAEQNHTELIIDRLNLGDVSIQTCRGCRLCFDRGESTCPHQDDLHTIKARIDAADGILCGSPVYVGDVSGLIKTLIDRLAYVCHRPAFFGKSVYLIATTAGSPTNATLNSLSGAFLSWGTHLAGRQGFTMGARMPKNEVQQRFGQKTDQIAKKLYTTIQKNRPANPSFLSLMVFRTQQYSWSRTDPETLDYQYWQEKGWTNPKTTFFMTHTANAVKVGLARMVGSILGRLWG